MNDSKTKTRNVQSVTQEPGGLGRGDPDVAYSTFQKDSEPGNKQGEDIPGLKNTLESGRAPLGLEGSSIDDYNRQESSEMQDI